MKTKVRIGGGIAVFAVFILLGGYRFIDLSVAVPWFLSVLLHETGHFFAAKICGAKVNSITLDVIGARMSLAGKMLSYGDEIFIAASGPCVNLVTAGLFFPYFRELSAFSLMLGLLNLMPAPGFDGYRIIHSAFSIFGGQSFAEKAMKIISFSSVAFLWLLSVYILLRFRSGFSMFLLSCALFCGFVG